MHKQERADSLADDIIKMESARTWDELERICADIEARHDAHGLSRIDLRTYEIVKMNHVKRVARTLVA
jgi:hypothetical protein